MHKMQISLVIGSFATFLVFQPSFDVGAQSGSRICGWKTTDQSSYADGSKPNGFAMAFVAEIGGKKNTHECDIATKSAANYMKRFATVKEEKTGKTIFLEWTRMRLKTCEEFAWANNVKLDGQGIKRDICQHMQRHQGFLITKPDSETKATFTRINMSTSWKDDFKDFVWKAGDAFKSMGYSIGYGFEKFFEYLAKAQVGFEDVDFKSKSINNAYGKSGITAGENGYSYGVSLSQNIKLCASLKFIPAIPADITELKRCGGPGKIKEDLITTAQIVAFAIKPMTAPSQGKPTTPTIVPRNGSSGFVPSRTGSGRPVPAQDIVMVALVDVTGTVKWEKPGVEWTVAGISVPAPATVLGIEAGMWMSPAYGNSDKIAMKCLLPFKKQGDFQSKALKSGADFRVTGTTNKNDKSAYEKAFKTLSQIRAQNKKSNLKGFLGFALPEQALNIVQNGACYYQDPLTVLIAGKKYDVLPPIDKLIKSNVQSPFEVNMISEVTGKITSLAANENKMDYKAEINLGVSMEVVLFNNFMRLSGKAVGKRKFSSKGNVKMPTVIINGSEVIK